MILLYSYLVIIATIRRTTTAAKIQSARLKCQIIIIFFVGWLFLAVMLSYYTVFNNYVDQTIGLAPAKKSTVASKEMIHSQTPNKKNRKQPKCWTQWILDSVTLKPFLFGTGPFPKTITLRQGEGGIIYSRLVSMTRKDGFPRAFREPSWQHLATERHQSAALGCQ
jgi:hypothetical protein